MPHQGRHGRTKCAARGSTSSGATSACKVRVECPRTGLRIGLGHMRARVEGGRERPDLPSGSRPSSAQLRVAALELLDARRHFLSEYRVLIGEGLLARRSVWNWQTSVVGAGAANLFLRDYLRGCATLLRSLPTGVPSMTRLGLPAPFVCLQPSYPHAIYFERHLHVEPSETDDYASRGRGGYRGSSISRVPSACRKDGPGHLCMISASGKE